MALQTALTLRFDDAVQRPTGQFHWIACLKQNSSASTQTGPFRAERLCRQFERLIRYLEVECSGRLFRRNFALPV